MRILAEEVGILYGKGACIEFLEVPQIRIE
jgi:hypothetical protein